ncbi:hypothetical protein BST85_09280 [Aureitalea marina]|uniref:TonB C-terminal domain-containing protein n=1 Tax=Aureitalea marina TaxID=930804 RepID=A0A2S7KTS6_9FLAO|nr:hypothetical protein BST85_09280 [Aureitalea marina]
MKRILLILCLFAGCTMMAQKSGNVSGNTVTMREVPPVWPGCPQEDIQAINACFTKNLIKHVSARFRYPEDALKNNEEGVVTVEFWIKEDGTPEIQSVEGGTKSLQEASRKNILSIPKMEQPGMLNGKPHKIIYTVPFTYKTGK